MAERRVSGKRPAVRPSPDGSTPRARSAPKPSGQSPGKSSGKPAKPAATRTGPAPPGQRGTKAARRSAVRVSRRGLAVGRWHGRWISVGAIVASVLIGLPLAHAVLGELGALALGLVAAGFALGRSTMRRN